MERKKLTFLQRELIRMKREKIQGAMNELGRIANEIAREHKIEEKDFGSWELSDDDNYIENKPRDENRR